MDSLKGYRLWMEGEQSENGSSCGVDGGGDCLCVVGKGLVNLEDPTEL